MSADKKYVLRHTTNTDVYIIYMLIKLRVFLLTLFILAILGCPKQPGQDEFIEIERIPNTVENERLVKFSSYPIDRQIDIFLFAQINLAGKRDTYMRYLANDGPTKKRHIAIRINLTDRASFKTNLIGVLDFIDLNCACVHDDAEVMELLIQNDSEVLDTDSPDVRLSKESYRQYLERMKSRIGR